MLVEARGGLPTGMDGHGSCPARTSITLLRVSRKFCVRFSSLRMQIEGCNCREYPDLKGGNLLCPLPCSTAGRVVYGHPIRTVKIPHITVIIRHNCRHFRVPVFIAIIDSTGCFVNIFQEAHVSLVPPHHSSQVIPGPYSNTTTFQSHCLGS